MPIKIWELLLLGRPIHRFFTGEGARKVLPQVLSDLQTDVHGDRDEFVRVLLESIPSDILPVSLSVGAYELKEEDGQEVVAESELTTYYRNEGLRELDIDIAGAKALGKDATVVVLPSMDDYSQEGTPRVLTIGNYFRVTYSRDQADPTKEELHRGLKAFDASGLEEGTVTLKRSERVSVEGEEASDGEEMLEFWVERLDE